MRAGGPAGRPSRRPRPAGAGTRARLLVAACEVIEKGGWEAASVAAIAQRTGVATGTLYRHFRSKAELFVEVVRATSEREIDAMYRAAGRVTSFGERFDAVVATYAGRALRNRPLAWALVYEPVDARVDAERLAYRRSYSQYMARLLEEGMELGAIPRQDAEMAAAAVVGVIAETLVGPLSPVAHVDVPEGQIAAAIAGLCRRVIGLESPGPPGGAGGGGGPA